MITKEQKVKFLEKLGYTVEDIKYTIYDDGGRYCDESYTYCECTLAYVVETEEVKIFKQSEYKYGKAESDWNVRDYMLELVYDRQFEQALYKVVYNSIAEIAE